MTATVSKRWIIADPIPSEIASSLQDFSAPLRQLLYNRGIREPNSAQLFLDCAWEAADPYLLTDMRVAIERILAAIDLRQPIAVYGDFDVDGVSATVLLVEVLRAYGAAVEPYIPNRFDEGYGLNNEALSALAAKGIRLVITVDCGTRSVDEARHARDLGMDMIISDHHHPGEQLPQAMAVLCPKRADDAYPEKNLAGVGLAYKIAQALNLARNLNGYDLEEWLDLVALGTVADIVPLTGENRSLVRRGILRMRHGQRPGLLSLAHTAGLTISGLNATDISFGLAPRLNAAGRLESALAAFELLSAQDVQSAGLLAQKLDDQNRERQRLTQEMQAQAETQFDGEHLDPILMAIEEGFNPGVVGLVAAKLSETYYRPAIIGTYLDGSVRASCRSIPEFHITHALDECADLLVRHGGHAAAAGFTVETEQLPALKARLLQISARELNALDLHPVLQADMEIALRDLRPDLLLEKDRLQPTGAENPEAAFVSRGLRTVRWRTVGADRKHLKITLTDGKVVFDGIAFRQGHWAEAMPDRIDALYNFERNFYNGRESLQLNIRDIHPANGSL